MTTANTNVQPPKSFGTDWSTVWSTVQATDYVIKTRMWLGVIILLVAYIAGCFFHATGWGMINIIIGSIAMLTVFVNAARPLMLIIFGLGGAIYAGTDKATDLGPGIKAGLVNLGRLANAVMLFIGLTFFLLGTWPFAVQTWMYALLPMGVGLIVNILIYEKMASKGWVWLLGGTYVIAVLLYGAVSEVPLVKAIFGWADVQQQDLTEAINESAANGGSTTQTAAPVKATASNGAAGDLDPMVVLPGTTSPEVQNLRPELEVCHNVRPAYVDREVQLQTGEWIKSSQQNGRTVVAIRVINNGTNPFTWSVWRQAPGQNCIRPQN